MMNGSDGFRKGLLPKPYDAETNAIGAYSGDCECQVLCRLTTEQTGRVKFEIGLSVSGMPSTPLPDLLGDLIRL